MVMGRGARLANPVPPVDPKNPAFATIPLVQPHKLSFTGLRGFNKAVGLMGQGRRSGELGQGRRSGELVEPKNSKGLLDGMMDERQLVVSKSGPSMLSILKPSNPNLGGCACLLSAFLSEYMSAM